MKVIVTRIRENIGAYIESEPNTLPIAQVSDSGFSIGELSVDLTPLFKPHSYLYAFEKNGKWTFIDAEKYIFMRDNATFLRSTHFITDFNAALVAAIWFGESMSQSIILFNRPINPAHLTDPVFKMPHSKPYIKMLIDHGASARANEIWVKYQAKRNTTMALSPQDSVAALEKQVDLLTKLVKTLAEAANVTLPTWAPEFFGVCEDTCYSNVKPEDVLVDEIWEYKGLVRHCQNQYHQEKNALLNQTPA